MAIVSIIMPTYNRASTIAMAIESILKQNYTDWELLVIDNGSTDNTREIVKSFEKKDSRVKYYNVEKSPNPGIADYLNFGIEKAQGQYIARLDDDDEWFDPDKLIKQVYFLDTHPEYLLTGGGAIMIDGNRKEMYRFLKRETDGKIRNNALYANPFCHNTVVFRKNIAIQLGGYNRLRFVEDWDLWLRIGKIGKLYNFQEYFSLYLNAGQNISISNQKLAGKTILGLLKKYKNEYPNFCKAYCLNFMQLVFAYIPSFIKRRVQNFLFFVKRNYF
jgi:glycosyltransferase involved in cell wall biosynthesis